MPAKILYVEDEAFLGKIVSESLESQGYHVLWVQDGNLGIPSFVEFSPEICILDVMLPNKDGFTIGKEIRAINPGIPIIYLTAKDQTEDVLKGFKSGGNDYVKKPFSVEELIARIENLLKISANGAAVIRDTYVIGKFTYDPLRMELKSDDHIQKLSHRENELLKVFAQHQNLPVERRKILKDLWGDDSFFNSRNLDVYVTRLRKYLKSDSSVEIMTLKGVGYQFLVG